MGFDEYPEVLVKKIPIIQFFFKDISLIVDNRYQVFKYLLKTELFMKGGEIRYSKYLEKLKFYLKGNGIPY